MKKWLFNPFMYMAGAPALLAGLALMLTTAVICLFSNTHFDGVVDAHNYTTSAVYYIIEPLIDWACCAVIFYFAAKIFSKSSIRFIDFAGTTMLARWPMLFYAVVGFGLQTPASINSHSTLDAVAKSITGTMIVCILIGLAFMIWMVALLYNAFAVSANMKGSRATGVFIGALIVAELISKLIFFLLY